jgi:hypothetical protein
MIIAQVKNQLGTLIGGGTVEFFDASSGYRLTVMDDDANDTPNARNRHAGRDPKIPPRTFRLSNQFETLDRRYCRRIAAGSSRNARRAGRYAEPSDISASVNAMTTKVERSSALRPRPACG